MRSARLGVKLMVTSPSRDGGEGAREPGSQGARSNQEALVYIGHGIHILFALLWVGAAIYLLALATRLVRAVERMADKVANKSQ